MYCMPLLSEWLNKSLLLILLPRCLWEMFELGDWMLASLKRRRTGPWQELGPGWKTDSIPVTLERARWSAFSWFHTVAISTLTSARKPGNRTLQTALGNLCCCCSVVKLCPVLCDFMDCSTPGSSVHHYLPEVAQIHIHWISDVT